MTRPIPQILILLTLCAAAAAQSEITVPWPTADRPTLKLTFSRFEQSAVANGQGIFTSNVTAQNVSDSAMPRSLFTVYISDKNNVRVGTALLKFPEIPPYRTQGAKIDFSAAGIPAGVTLLAGKTISLRIISVPPGANLKVDGEDAGITPRLFDFTVGAHTLEFSKEGYATGNTALDVTSDELPGGSVSFELGGLSQDTVELRDGTVILGDVLSMSMTDVTMGINGKVQKYDRNQIKKIMLVEREAPAPKKAPSK